MTAGLHIVTVTWNSLLVLEAFLASVPRGVPVTVVDNASDDDPTPLAQCHGARVLRLSANIGFGAACNAGAAAAAEADLFLFCNPDIAFAPGAVEALHAAARAHPNAAFNPRIYARGRRRFRARSRLLPPEAVWRGPPPDEDVAIPVLHGACMLVRKSHFEAVGGFDPEIFLYHEDDDLSRRLIAAGVELRLAASASVEHAEGRSSPRSAEVGALKGEAMGRSLVHVMRKHGVAFDLEAERRRARRGMLLPHTFFNAARLAKRLGFLRGLDVGELLSWRTESDGADFVPSRADPAPPNDVKLVAYYLPQFHPIPENDAWWGEGFTEWTNVSRALPLFDGHDQPRVPGELGYYDLRDTGVMHRQVALAKHYGIAAFAFHFYWFGGRTLLETPVRNYLADPSLDLPFSLCWANENWTRRWSGRDKEVLIAQKHSPDDDLAFLRHVDRYFRDPRYLRVDGRPVLTVYRPGVLPDAAATVARWREEAERLGYPGLYLIATNAFGYAAHDTHGFDALSEFPPHGLRAPEISGSLKMSPLRKRARVRSYEAAMRSAMRRAPAEGTVHPGVMPSWDNTARRQFSGTIFHGATPALFGEWLAHAAERASCLPEGRRLVFINAWNEWAEGACLEPDRRYGYGYLGACADIAADARPTHAAAAIAVHVFYPDLLDEILERVGALPPRHKMFVTAPPEHEQEVSRKLQASGRAHALRVLANRGRDILPFLCVLPEIRAEGFAYVAKVHTKASPHRRDGAAWRRQLLDAVLEPSSFAAALSALAGGAGMVGPRGHYLRIGAYLGANEERVLGIAARLGIDPARARNLGFFAGSMFAARMDALAPLLALGLSAADFEPEAGHKDGTLAHVLERCMALAAVASGRSVATEEGTPAGPAGRYRFARRT